MRSVIVTLPVFEKKRGRPLMVDVEVTPCAPSFGLCTVVVPRPKPPLPWRLGFQMKPLNFVTEPSVLSTLPRTPKPTCRRPILKPPRCGPATCARGASATFGVGPAKVVAGAARTRAAMNATRDLFTMASGATLSHTVCTPFEFLTEESLLFIGKHGSRNAQWWGELCPHRRR